MKRLAVVVLFGAWWWHRAEQFDARRRIIQFAGASLSYQIKVRLWLGDLARPHPGAPPTLPPPAPLWRRLLFAG